jgi:uncharacterized RDD family membrane protein YckC
VEYFITIAGERTGPFSQYQVIERIREGSLSGAEPAWHKGLENWIALRQFDEFDGYWPLTDDQISRAEHARAVARAELDRPQPWLRFWARIFDCIWFMFIVSAFSNLLLPQRTQEELILSMVRIAPFLYSIVFALFIPLEALLLSRRGMTPGKALLRIQVRRQDGTLPTFPQALRRSAQVYVRGLGMALLLPFGLPALPVLSMAWSLRLLRQRGTTSWDEANGLRVEHGEPETWRFLVVAAVVGFVIVAGVFFTLQFMEAMKNGSLPK